VKTSSTSPEDEMSVPFSPSWDHDMNRERLEIGDTFYFTDEDAFCGTQYKYQVGVSYRDQGAVDDGVFNPELSQTENKIIPWDCQVERVEGMHMDIDVHQRGYHITRWIDQLEDWYQGEIPERIFIQLFRYSPDTRLPPKRINLVEGYNTFTGSTSSKIGLVVFVDSDFDEGSCGQTFVYIMRIRNAETQELIARAFFEAPNRYCSIPNSVHFWDFSVGQYYQQYPGGTYHLNTVIDIEIPGNIPYLHDRLFAFYVNPPSGPDREIYRLYEIDSRTLSDGGGLHIHENIPGLMECGTRDYEFVLEVFQDVRLPSDDIYHGITYDTRSFWVTPLPCMPQRPWIKSLHAHMCDGVPCIEVDWTPGVFDDDVRAYPPDEILFQRHAYYPDNTEVIGLHFPIDQTHYTDTDVAPDQAYTYFIRYNYQNMHTYESRSLIFTPSDAIWDCMVTNAGESDCNE
jgi:hypothetical protein